jgi:Transglutaminase-like superfamily
VADTGISNNEIRNSNNTNCTFQTLDEAKRDAYQFLCQNVMEFDRPFMETMGFSDNYTFQGKVNGDSGGLIGPTIDLALRAKRNFASADALPQHIWQEYVLNYANLNEGRTNIRPILYDRLVVPLFLQERSSPVYNVDDMVDLVNDKLWTTLAPPSSCLWNETTQQDDCRIRYVSGQTPACIDPMSVLVYGSASGTGLAVLLVHALRAAGIAARVAGTPAWHKDADNGNHNWVEYHVGKRTTGSSSAEDFDYSDDDDDDDENDWAFVEPSPMGNERDNYNFYGHLNRGGGGPFDPWFCQARYLRHGTQFYAARLLSPASTRTTSITTPFFPLAWEGSNRHVPAQNRTAFYRRLCCRPLYDDDDGQDNKNDDSACYDYDEYRESSDVIGNS